MPRFEMATQLAAAPRRCFELALSVDAHAASMASSGERAVAGVTRGQLKLGDSVTWRARHFGVWFRMTSAITVYAYPSRFVDEQVDGPFTRWRHEHLFEQLSSGGTRMIDVVEFRSPGGPLGRLVDRLFLVRYLTGLIRQRNTWLQRELEPGK